MRGSAVCFARHSCSASISASYVMSSSPLPWFIYMREYALEVEVMRCRGCRVPHRVEHGVDAFCTSLSARAHATTLLRAHISSLRRHDRQFQKCEGILCAFVSHICLQLATSAPSSHESDADHHSSCQFLSRPDLFRQIHTHTDVRLALGWLSVLVAGGTGLYGWRVPFEQSKPGVWAGVLL